VAARGASAAARADATQFSVSILASYRPALDDVRGQRRRTARLISPLLARYDILAGRTGFGLRGMTFWVRLIIYAGTVLLYVMTAAWIVRAWTRRRYRDNRRP
jgi:hypothetical protein